MESNDDILDFKSFMYDWMGSKTKEKLLIFGLWLKINNYNTKGNSVLCLKIYPFIACPKPE